MADQNDLKAVFLQRSPYYRLVKFEASWCGPCKALNPTLQRYADDFEEVLEVYVVDVDEDPDLAVEHKVRSVPTTILFNENGIELSREVGVFPYNRFRAYLELKSKRGPA
tara:strand:- start:1703 stop:2032 length:330 start_codon:yes stop_codon:yes gene_type:complete